MNALLLDTDWQIEELKHEISRVNRILRSPELPPEEKAIAEAQLANYLDQLTEEMN